MRNNYLSVILAFAFVINENGKKKSILNVCFLHNISQVHNGKLNDPYCSPNIVWVIKSRIMRWAGHVVRMGERRGGYRGLVGNLRKRHYLGDPGIDVTIKLLWIFRKQDVGVWTGSSWLRIGTGGGHLGMR